LLDSNLSVLRGTDGLALGHSELIIFALDDHFILNYLSLNKN